MGRWQMGDVVSVRRCGRGGGGEGGEGGGGR